MSAQHNEPMVHNVLEEQARWEPDAPEMQREIADSITDERALAIRRLADSCARIVHTADIRHAFDALATDAA